jgi:arginine/lysine/ornithine decarboxylase
VAGKKYGVIMAAKVPGSYFAMSEAERNEPGEVIGQLMAKYAGKIELVRRYWTSAFTAEVSDVFVMECDDLMDAHNMMQESTQLMAKSGDPERFGETKVVWVGINPDA